jgi:hypothetical protein
VRVVGSDSLCSRGSASCGMVEACGMAHVEEVHAVHAGG